MIRNAQASLSQSSWGTEGGQAVLPKESCFCLFLKWRYNLHTAKFTPFGRFLWVQSCNHHDNQDRDYVRFSKTCLVLCWSCCSSTDSPWWPLICSVVSFSFAFEGEFWKELRAVIRRWLDSITNSMDMSFLGDGEGQGSLACCSPWGRKELDVTEQLHHHHHKEQLLIGNSLGIKWARISKYWALWHSILQGEPVEFQFGEGGNAYLHSNRLPESTVEWSGVKGICRRPPAMWPLFHVFCLTRAIHFPGGLDGKVSAYSGGNSGSIPGLGRSPGKGNGNPFQYSCLENPPDGGAW